MAQINIKVNKELDKLLDYFARKKKIPKSVYVKELLMENLKEKLIPKLLKEYEEGKLGLKKILYLTEISPDELLDKIQELDIKCPITPDIDEYTSEITEDLINRISL